MNAWVKGWMNDCEGEGEYIGEGGLSEWEGK